MIFSQIFYLCVNWRHVCRASRLDPALGMARGVSGSEVKGKAQTWPGVYTQVKPAIKSEK